ncbi:ABC transporter permease [Lacticaseibacillus paracasei]|uniref:ABC transporter permease n=1 Tax=Lacticaseibacillus paracasei TaxID=1597 RepID=UPI001F50B9D1|nr:ABC transporter permease [Lacticaseibacillus paracasei]MCI0375901.1 ABC transporter permease [Lacticaseibacillus paracasei]MCI0375964.1 ABC transporter permease [Lacticaseibacillus paracasei]
MKKYIVKRVLIAVLTLFVITLALFVMEKAMPGSPFNDEKMTRAQLQILYAKYGLDKPVLIQFWDYLKHMLTGDFGVSYSVQVNTPVVTMIAQHFPISLQIGLQATVLGAVIGMGLGIIAALKHNSWIDNLMTGVSVIGVSLPNFVVALILSLLFSYLVHWMPAVYDADRSWISTVLPTVALSTFTMASIERYARSEMVDVMQSDYYRLADAKGITHAQLILRHVLRNTLISVITVLAPLMIDLIAGSMVIEKAFSIPGLGTLYISAIQANDYNVVLGITFFYALLFVSIMLVVDVLYGVIDPRVRLEKR